MLCVKNNGDASNRSGGRKAGAASTQLNGKKEENQQPGAREQKHGGTRVRDAVAKDGIRERQIRFDTRRVDVRDGRVRNKRTIPQQIQRTRNKLAQLVPEVRQSEQTEMDREKRSRKNEKENDQIVGTCSFGPFRCECKRRKFGHRRPPLREHWANYWMTSPCPCASSLISPNAASYCFRFC